MVTLNSDDLRPKVSVARAAKLLGVGPGRVRSFITDGRLEAAAFDDRTWCVYCDSLVAFGKLDRRPGNPGSQKR